MTQDMNTIIVVSKNVCVEFENNNYRRNRYMILVLTTACCASIYANMIAFNFTVMCMSKGGNDDGNSTTDSMEKIKFYTKYEANLLRSAVAVGALLATVPFLIFYGRTSARHILAVAGIITIVSTAVVPLSIQLGFAYILVVRIVQGISFAAIFPIIGLVTANWALSTAEHGLFLAVLTGFGQIGQIYSIPLSGYLCETSIGWSAVYYVQSFTSLLVFAIWFFYFCDVPHSEQLPKMPISTENRHINVPYKSILKTATVWGIWIAAFADLLFTQFHAQFISSYLKQILDFETAQTGIYAALPIVGQFAFKLIAGVASDHISFISETTSLRIFNSISLVISAIFIVMFGFVNRQHMLLAEIMLFCAESAIGCHSAGFNKCATMISRQYSHFVMGQIQTLWAIAILIEPLIVSAFLNPTNASAHEWRMLFIMHAALLIIGNFVFCVFATSKPAKWTNL